MSVFAFVRSSIAISRHSAQDDRLKKKSGDPYDLGRPMVAPTIEKMMGGGEAVTHMTSGRRGRRPLRSGKMTDETMKLHQTCRGASRSARSYGTK